MQIAKTWRGVAGAARRTTPAWRSSAPRASAVILAALAANAAAAPLNAPAASELPRQALAGREAFADAMRAGGAEPMPNAEVRNNPLMFRQFTDYVAAWNLADRPRTIALLVDDMQIEYSQYVEGILPQVAALVRAFRAAGLPIFWSVWWRWGPDDGYFNAMDRFYGPGGVRSRVNALYNYDPHGADIIAAAGPVSESERARVMRKSYSLSMFDERAMEWAEPAAQGTLDAELRALGVDTVVQVGAWTDDCIIATAFQALSLQYDVVVVEDGVSTASRNHFAALEVMRGAAAKVLTTAQVLAHLNGTAPPHPAEATAPLLRAPAPRPRRGTDERGTELGSARASAALHVLDSVVVAALAGALGYILGRQRAARSRSTRGACSQSLLERE